jgi:hypothetical protein
VAAVVDGQVIASHDIAQATDELNRYFKGGAGEKDVAYLAVLSPYLESVVQQAGGWTPPADYYSILDKIGPHSQLTEKVLAASVLRQMVLGNEATATALVGALGKADIQLDPRYGVVDPTTASQEPLPEPWIVPTPSAG